MYLNNPTLNALLLFAIAFGSFLITRAIHRGNANVASSGKLSLASRIKPTCKQTAGD